MSFSIIIPTLNEENYIEKLLDSLIEQTYTDFEVIVVDGSSDDNTQENARKYIDKLDITVVAAPRRGVSFQRNYGAKRAKNEHLIFFDADIIIEKAFLNKINDYIENTSVDMLTAKNAPLSNKIVDKIAYWIYFSLYVPLYKNKNPVAVGTFIYFKKEVFINSNGFDEKIIFGEDSEIVRRLFEQGATYAYLKDPVVMSSVRRFEKEGRLHCFWKHIYSYFYQTLKGPITAESGITHEMDGTHV